MSTVRRMCVGVVVGSLVTGGVLALPTAVSAGTKPPPCSTKAVKAGLKAMLPTLPDGARLTQVSKVCARYWAGGGFVFTTPDGGSGSGAYLLRASGGKWKYVSFEKNRTLCDQGKVPAKVAAKACLP